jgi:hypothetical protein
MATALPPSSPKTVFVCADHGLALVYFLQSDVASTLGKSGVSIVLLTDDGIVDRVRSRFGDLLLAAEGMRLDQVRAYERKSFDLQWWLGFLRRVGGSRRINTRAMDSYVEQVLVEISPRQIPVMPLALLARFALRRSRRSRKALLRAQQRFTPRIYGDLFERYRPNLVVASTPGWRQDRYLLREAAARGLPTASVVVGWDNPSSYSLPGAPVRDIVCWSGIQKEELVLGSDWDPAHVHIGGIPIYDGYLRREWVVPRQEYFRQHGLDPQRKLLSYACSFVSFSPNYQNVEALAELVSSDGLGAPCQLIVRLHPNHFWDNWLFADERARLHRLAQQHPHVHIVEPVPIGGSLGYYSGEDVAEKASMMAHADVFLTVYSTMVVEAAIHDRPVISVCIDAPRGWGYTRRFYLRKYSLPLSRIGDWPTHDRFRRSGAGRVVFDRHQLGEAVEAYLRDPAKDREARRAFVERDITFTDGSAGVRTANELLSLMQGGQL